MMDFTYGDGDWSSLFGPGADTPDLSGILGDVGNNDLGINIDPFTGGTWGTPDLSGIDPSTIDLLGGLGASGGSLFDGPNWLNAIGSVTGLLGGGPTTGTGGSSGGGSSGSTSGGKGSSSLSSLLGGNGLASLLPMLLAAGGGIMNRNATNEATQQAVQGINNASTQAQNLIGGAQQNYQPYMQAGTAALSKLAGMGNSNIAGMFKPLGSGRGIR